MRSGVIVGLVLCGGAALGGLAIWLGPGATTQSDEASGESAATVAAVGVAPAAGDGRSGPQTDRPPASEETSAPDATAARDPAAAAQPPGAVGRAAAGRDAPAKTAPASATGPDDGRRTPAPGVMERIVTAEAYLKSLLGDIETPLDASQRERLARDGAFRDWMAELESKVGDGLDDAARRAMRTRQVYTVDLRNRLQEAYLSGGIDWAAYLDGLRAVSLWSDEPYQRLLTAEQYRQVNGFDKSDMATMADAAWEPPERVEALNLFPQIRAGNPEITQQELERVIPQDRLVQLSDLRKAQLLQEAKLTADLDSGAIDQEAFLAALQKNQADLSSEAKALLSAEGYRLLFPEATE